MKKHKATLIGVGMILLALIIVLSAVLIPRIVQKNKMKEHLAKMMAEDVQIMIVEDPLFMKWDLLGNNGTEVVLEGEQFLDIRAKLQAMIDGGYRVDYDEKRDTGAWDMNLRVRTATGESLRLWIDEATFYMMEDTFALGFCPKDEAAYAALREAMIAVLQ